MSTDLKDAKLVGKVWKVNVSTNESTTLTLSVVDEYKQYVTIGRMRSHIIFGCKCKDFVEASCKSLYLKYVSPSTILSSYTQLLSLLYSLCTNMERRT